MRTKEERLEVANTILAQLGGNRFRVMTGAKNFLATETSLIFTFGRSKKFTINLDASDTYTLEVHRLNYKAGTAVKIDSATDVYCDMLQSVFTRMTGLHTRL